MLKTIQYKNGVVKLIDQTKLPGKLEIISCGDVKSLWQAIKELKVRGAPAIGVAAAYGVVLGIKDYNAKDRPGFIKRLESITGYLGKSRPTAVNLFWALERMKRAGLRKIDEGVISAKDELMKEASLIADQDRQVSRSIGRHGAKLIKEKDRILTICNTGMLATSDYGTAAGCFYQAKKENKDFSVFACETRPLLQGARLTCWELMRAKIKVTLLTDSMAADLMRKKMIDKIFVGADRIASNGDTANKIGTYNLAVLAKFHKVPFYVAAPFSTFDLSISDGSQIKIEDRDADEVRCIRGFKIAPENVSVYNPAFDVTSHKLISAFITEKGIIKPPFQKYLNPLDKR